MKRMILLVFVTVQLYGAASSSSGVQQPTEAEQRALEYFRDFLKNRYPELRALEALERLDIIFRHVSRYLWYQERDLPFKLKHQELERLLQENVLPAEFKPFAESLAGIIQGPLDQDNQAQDDFDNLYRDFEEKYNASKFGDIIIQQEEDRIKANPRKWMSDIVEVLNYPELARIFIERIQAGDYREIQGAIQGLFQNATADLPDAENQALNKLVEFWNSPENGLDWKKFYDEYKRAVGQISQEQAQERASRMEREREERDAARMAEAARAREEARRAGGYSYGGGQASQEQAQERASRMEREREEREAARMAEAARAREEARRAGGYSYGGGQASQEQAQERASRMEREREEREAARMAEAARAREEARRAGGYSYAGSQGSQGQAQEKKAQMKREKEERDAARMAEAARAREEARRAGGYSYTR